MSILERIDGPEDVRGLSREELHELVVEARERHVDVISKIGGHFGASLGVAELTVALHYTFEAPRDKLIWDTGHQGYIHKILTGRNERLPTIRQKDGLAPFLRRDESEFDHFGAGHAATSISAALGTAIARDLNGDDFSVVAIIGDGAMGCGLAYEALNNAGHTDRNLIVILNDNDHSIAPNVGAMNKYLTGVRTNPLYNRIRDEVKDLLSKGPGGEKGVMRRLASRLDEKLKGLFVPGMLFEELGFRYIGPVDGHDLDSLVETLARARRLEGPILVHVITQKGKGFSPAEQDAYTWHARPPFDKISGEVKKGSGGLPRYQKVFGQGLKELGELDPRIVAFTGGMPDGTSTDIFGEAFPDRFFDVGIAEGHAVTAAAGMAAVGGVRPLVCIYSTFLQRALRQHHPRCRAPGSAGRFLYGSGRTRGPRWAHASRRLRHSVHATRAGYDRDRPQGRGRDDGARAPGHPTRIRPVLRTLAKGRGARGRPARERDPRRRLRDVGNPSAGLRYRVPRHRDDGGRRIRGRLGAGVPRHPGGSRELPFP